MKTIHYIPCQIAPGKYRTATAVFLTNGTTQRRIIYRYSQWDSLEHMKQNFGLDCEYELRTDPDLNKLPLTNRDDIEGIKSSIETVLLQELVRVEKNYVSQVLELEERAQVK